MATALIQIIRLFSTIIELFIRRAEYSCSYLQLDLSKYKQGKEKAHV